MSNPFHWRPRNKPVYNSPHAYEYTTYRMSQPSISFQVKMFDASMTDLYVKL